MMTNTEGLIIIAITCLGMLTPILCKLIELAIEQMRTSRRKVQS